MGVEDQYSMREGLEVLVPGLRLRQADADPEARIGGNACREMAHVRGRLTLPG